MKRLEHVRIMMYSHDSLGLGHLRRCRTIAHSLVEDFKGLTVMIVTGSQIAGAFDLRARVDFVKIPSVIKLYNGEYTSIDKHIDLQETLQMRQSIIQHTVESFQPDLLLVDKEPLGLRGELAATLRYLRGTDTTTVLGLRDVMDSPEKLRAEWAPNRVLAQIEELYDDIWVYGPRDFWDPLQGLGASDWIRSRMTYLGFLRRAATPGKLSANLPRQPYLLVTSGGGSDGARIMRQVIAAYRSGSHGLLNAVMVLGPLMPGEERADILRECQSIDQIHAIEFDNQIESLVANASGLVSMGGYNTFCEILSFDLPALVIPRITPREEQLIRTRRAASLGLIEMLHPDAADNPAMLAQLLAELPGKRRPSQARARPMLNGLESISQYISDWSARRSNVTEFPRLVVKG